MDNNNNNNNQQYYNQPPQGYYYPQYGYNNPNNFGNFQQNNFEKKRLRNISIAVGLSVIGFTVLSYMISLGLSLIPNFFDNYRLNDMFSSSVDIIYSIAAIVIPFSIGYYVLKKKKLVGRLPLGTPYDYSAFGLLIFACLMACLLGSYATGVFGGVVENVFGIKFSMPEDGVQLTTVPIILLYIVKSAIIPAFIEEFAIRGVVMQSLRKYGDMFAIVMSALVFSLMHGNMVQIPFAFIAGIAIGYAVVVTGSMWTGVIIHFLNNFISVMMQVSIDNLPENVATVACAAMSLSVIAIGIACSLVYYKKFSRVPLSKCRLNIQKSDKLSTFLITPPMIIAFIILFVQTSQYISYNG